jgi:hypothetical protein
MEGRGCHEELLMFQDGPGSSVGDFCLFCRLDALHTYPHDSQYPVAIQGAATRGGSRLGRNTRHCLKSRTNGGDRTHKLKEQGTDPALFCDALACGLQNVAQAPPIYPTPAPSSERFKEDVRQCAALCVKTVFHPKTTKAVSRHEDGLAFRVPAKRSLTLPRSVARCTYDASASVFKHQQMEKIFEMPSALPSRCQG